MNERARQFLRKCLSEQRTWDAACSYAGITTAMLDYVLASGVKPPPLEKALVEFFRRRDRNDLADELEELL